MTKALSMMACGPFQPLVESVGGVPSDLVTALDIHS